MNNGNANIKLPITYTNKYSVTATGYLLAYLNHINVEIVNKSTFKIMSKNANGVNAPTDYAYWIAIGI